MLPRHVKFQSDEKFSKLISCVRSFACENPTQKCDIEKDPVVCKGIQLQKHKENGISATDCTEIYQNDKLRLKRPLSELNVRIPELDFSRFLTDVLSPTPDACAEIRTFIKCVLFVSLLLPSILQQRPPAIKVWRDFWQKKGIMPSFKYIGLRMMWL